MHYLKLELDCYSALFICIACSRVVHVTSITPSLDKIVIKWMPMTDDRRRGLYVEIQYNEDGYTDWDLKLLPPSIHQHTIKGLFPGTKYVIRLRTLGESGVFGPVTTKKVTTKRKCTFSFGMSIKKQVKWKRLIVPVYMYQKVQ